MRINDRLYSQIKGGVYHSTNISGYRGIRALDAILPNTGMFPFSHGQSPHSCCHKLGAIALLDLRNPSPARPLVGKEAWHNWTRFLSNHDPITILLDIDPDRLSEPLQDYDSLQERFPMSTMVAEAEKCYAAQIPFDAIRRCVLVCAKWRTFFRVVAGNQISDADFLRAENGFEAKLRKIGWKDPFSLGDVLKASP
jgi:hypothetical protein